MKRERRSYDKEFKLMVVNLYLIGKPIKEVSEELGIRRELISRLKLEFGQYREGVFLAIVWRTITLKEISRHKTPDRFGCLISPISEQVKGGSFLRLLWTYLTGRSFL